MLNPMSDTSPETSKIKKGCGITRRVVAGSFKGLGRRSFLGYSRGKNYGLMWKPKVESKIDEGFGGVFSSPFDVNGNESTLLGQTTVMIKNIPNKFREMLLDLLDKHCLGENEKAQLSSNPCLSAYDFVYLPMDFRNRCNLGYAFVNFTSTVAASRLCRSFHNYRWQVFDTKKICEIRDAKIQFPPLGKAALMGHFRSSYFKCDTDDFLPVEFSPARNGSTSCTPPSIVGKRTAFL
ncbi:hypothetical protein HHK36_032980 [Tetracentron sinense]|uniref:Mei2-like C-terminal RNA recognition motif domain-containing protein n=1 Tax=Tetracentron sinense TaxID=13715 RepID=A0A834Y6U5_TETSI|nr:hypothetical protein HHK36_032980 [Tetracentron sinense]